MLLIDGKKVAADLRQRVKNDVDALVRAHGRAPHLAVILVGEDPASQVYVRNKIKACEAVGVHSEKYEFPADTPPEKVLQLSLIHI